MIQQYGYSFNYGPELEFEQLLNLILLTLETVVKKPLVICSEINIYLPLVRCEAKRIHKHLPSSVDIESLFSSGVVGLLDALNRFDPCRKVDFTVYARYRIQGEIMDYLRSLDWVSRSVRSGGRKFEAARDRLAAKFLREPTAEETAVELKMSLEEYYKLDQHVNCSQLIGFEDLLANSEITRTNQPQERMVACANTNT